MSVLNAPAKSVRFSAAPLVLSDADPDADAGLRAALEIALAGAESAPLSRHWTAMTAARQSRFLAAARGRMPDAVLALEAVWSPHNQAAVVRTCDGLGIGELWRSGRSEFRPDSTVAIGAERWVERREFADATALANAAQRRGLRLLASDLNPAARPLHEFDLTVPVVLLLGNEHDGVSPEARAAADGIFYLPMAGLSQSFNVSVAAAMAGYELRRQRLLRRGQSTLGVRRQREQTGIGLRSSDEIASTRLLRWLADEARRERLEHQLSPAVPSPL